MAALWTPLLPPEAEALSCSADDIWALTNILILAFSGPSPSENGSFNCWVATTSDGRDAKEGEPFVDPAVSIPIELVLALEVMAATQSNSCVTASERSLASKTAALCAKQPSATALPIAKVCNFPLELPKEDEDDATVRPSVSRVRAMKG